MRARSMRYVTSSNESERVLGDAPLSAGKRSKITVAITNLVFRIVFWDIIVVIDVFYPYKKSQMILHFIVRVTEQNMTPSRVSLHMPAGPPHRHT